MTYDKLTDKQKARVEEFLREVEAHGAESAHLYQLVIELKPEQRAGRGHDITVTFIDSDFVAHAYIDVYGGGGNASFGRVDWFCYEEGRCETCEPPCPACGIEMGEILADDGWQRVCCEPGCPESIENP